MTVAQVPAYGPRFVPSWPFRCPTCGRFLGRVVATGNELEGVKTVTGACSRDGRVESAPGWGWDDLGPVVEIRLG